MTDEWRDGSYLPIDATPEQVAERARVADRRAEMPPTVDGFAFLDEGDDCTRCGGDGFEECDDPIQCMRTYHIGDEHECGACGGSGLAKDQTVW